MAEFVRDATNTAWTEQGWSWETTCRIATPLAPYATFQWGVLARDPSGATAASGGWEFTTGCGCEPGPEP